VCVFDRLIILNNDILAELSLASLCSRVNIVITLSSFQVLYISVTTAQPTVCIHIQGKHVSGITSSITHFNRRNQ